MAKMIDLNRAPIDQYPIIKILTETDVTTSQLVLPKPSMEEFILPHMPDDLKKRLTEGDGRAPIWVVDDQMCSQHYLTMVDRDHCYSIITWEHICEHRKLKEGQEIRLGWMDEKLHFIVTTEGIEAYFADDDEPNEDVKATRKIHANVVEQPQENNMEGKSLEPPTKRLKTEKGQSSSSTKQGGGPGPFNP